MRASLIIAAGGSGSRFENSLQVKQKFLSKLFYPLAGRPLIEHTIEAFQPVPQIKETVIAAPASALKLFKEMVRRNKWKNVSITPGGSTRAESVWKALQKIKSSSPFVLVHDGARPMITQEALQKLFKASRKHDLVLLAKKVTATIKEAEGKDLVQRTVSRDFLYEAETPQLMSRKLLEKAYKTVPHAFQATDESSLLEAAGVKSYMVTHSDWNPKITNYQDLKLVSAYLNASSLTRTGFGRDTHRLVAGRPLWLGGVLVPHDRGPLGHSDGDALLHAIIDAILGATGAGDIGDWFSDQDEHFKDISSSMMLAKILHDAKQKKYQVAHLDTVITLERPRLGDFKQKIKAHLAQLLELPFDAVSIKAKTAEGMGPEGAGLAITCEALVTLKKDLL